MRDPAPAFTVSLPCSAAMSLQGGVKAVDQRGSGEGLGQEANCSRLQRPGADALIGEGRDENERHTVALGAHGRQRPLITDICTSAITHEVSFNWADRRNSSADANVWTVYPCDLRRLLVAARTDASSSMMEIAESVDKAGLPDAGTKRLPERRCPAEKT